MATFRTYMTPSGGVVTFNANRDYMAPDGSVISEQLIAAPGGTNPKGPFTHPFYGPFRGPIS